MSHEGAGHERVGRERADLPRGGHGAASQRHRTRAGTEAGAPLGDALLLRLTTASVLAIVVWFMVRPWLPQAWRVPGSAELYLTGVAGVALLLVPLAFAIVKRAGATTRPNAWFAAHVWCAFGGAVLIAVHSGGHLRRAPALLLLALVLLAVMGVWARTSGARRMASTFGTKVARFEVPSEISRARLGELISRKRRILSQLDPAASEATFSVTLAHLLRAPRLAVNYLRCARVEARLLGTRAAVGTAQAWWRPLHMALAWLFVVGVAVHVFTVTFLAGWVAGYGEVHWWHLAAW